jgi:hypothetical protein
MSADPPKVPPQAAAQLARLGVSAAEPHPAALVAPFFAPQGGTALHRYLDGDFIPRFLNDAAAGRLSDPAVDDWWRDDRFSDHDDRLVLRLPIHRTFYVVCCEAVCDRPGQPALDPERIRSAGFVIRRIGGEAERRRSRREIRRRERGALVLALKERLGGRGAMQVQAESERLEDAAFERSLSAASTEQAWVLEEGEPLGWQPASAPARDPDLGRRACLNGVLRRGPLPPAYSGEETHPLHPVAARDASGKRHTLLFAFLPLGGQALARGNPFDPAAETGAVDADRAAHPWPFGLAGRPTGDWWESDARQVTGGRPSPAFFVLLETLVNRYRLGEARGERTDPLNAGLAEAARGLRFVDDSVPPKTLVQPSPKGGARFVQPGSSKGGGKGGRPDDLDGVIQIAWPSPFNLFEYLEACFAAGEANPLTAWLAAERRRIDDAGGLAAAGSLAPLPAHPADGAVSLSLSLYVDAEDGKEWRTLLGERLLGQARRTGSEIPIPKFRQEAEDLFQVVPFLRVADDRGRERVLWGGPAVRSEPFRVAAPFDPDASRPVLIQMPSLSDLRRGMAKGATMLIPPDTQGLLETLKLTKGASPGLADAPPPDPQAAAALGVQWICSFSIPIVTLVAMILLMIIVSLLNIVFFWLPWVRICLPFPKIK